jgi:hypothetical protein
MLDFINQSYKQRRKHFLIIESNCFTIGIISLSLNFSTKYSSFSTKLKEQILHTKQTNLKDTTFTQF